MDETDVTLLGLSEIAKLAGTRPSAVTNWRKRYDDFPTPVLGLAGASPKFRLFEVEAWLKQHGKRPSVRAKQRPETDVEVERALWQAANILRDVAPPDEHPTLFCAAWTLATLTGRHRKHVRADNAGRPDVERLAYELSASNPMLRDAFTSLIQLHGHAAERLVEYAQELLRDGELGDPAEVFEAVLETRDRRRSGESATTAPLADLLARIAAPETPVRILDPAVGEAAGLLAAASAYGDGIVELVGYDVNNTTLRLAAQRLAIHGYTATLQPGNSLYAGLYPPLLADVIFCDPPWGATIRSRSQLSGSDPRWHYGVPGRSDEFLWVQHVIFNLADEGRGYVLLPPSTLFRGGAEERIRNRLIGAGAIEAIVSLPQGIRAASAIAPVLWVLRKPAAAARPNRVLFVDASASTGDRSRRPAIDPDLRDRIVGTLRAWRHGTLAEGTDGFAAAIDVVDLLAADANLVPSRWVRRQPDDGSDQLGDRAHELTARLRQFASRAARQPVPEITVTPAEQPGSLWSVRDLIRDGHITLIAGIRASRGDLADKGSIRALVAENVREGGPVGEARYLDPESLDHSVPVTSLGDIIVTSIGTRLRAMVDRGGGNTFVYPLQCLRINRDWLDADYVAAFLGSERSTRYAVGTIPRINVRDLELPRYTAEQAGQLVSILAQIRDLETAAINAAATGKQLRDTLIEAAMNGMGVETAADSPGNDDDEGGPHA